MKGKVLIVDDDQMIAETYLLRLQRSGFEAEAVQDGKTAIKKIEESDPDVVLLDAAMYPMNGFDVLKAINKMPGGKKIRVIFLTNVDEQQSMDEAKNLGAVDYIVKAKSTPAEVAEKVEKVMAS